jgi:drug/metabolite transporter (DMT)-like permease
VTAALWAVASGVGFGLFQSLNRRALLDIEDAYVSTFINLAIAAIVLLAVALATEDFARLLDADAWTLAAFAGAGIVHFLLGWTFLNLSQRRIGAARTSPLLTMTPVFALAVAAIAVGQLPGPAALAAIVPMVLGAYLVAGGGREARGVDALPGLACALMWAVSPVLTLEGLDGLDSPLLGVTLGMVASVMAYGVFLLGRRRHLGSAVLARDVLGFKIAAGTLVALATWLRWVAIDGADVAVVLALALVSVPIVLFLSPLLVGRHLEHVTRQVWLGAGLVVAGALTLIAVG